MKQLLRNAAGAALLWILLILLGSGAEAMTLEETSKGGKVSRRTWTEQGVTVNGPEGYAYITYSYNDTTVTEKYYSADDQPFETPGGYCARALTYGNRHRLSEVIYYDAAGNRTENTAGYARVRIGYTAKGQVTNVNYYGKDNKPVTVPGLGYAMLRNDYRGTTLTQTLFQDEKKNPVNIPAGYAAMIQRVNKNNQIVEIRFEKADGSAAICAAGWAACKRTLDGKGRTTEAAYSDADGMPVNTAGGYAREERIWESDSSCIVRYYTAQGEEMMPGETYAALRRETDREGRVRRESYLDRNGQSATNRLMAGATAYFYDEQNRICRVVLEDGNGNELLGTEGWAEYQDTLDENGFVLKRVYAGTDGKPLNIAEGYSEVHYSYDEAGRIRSVEYLDTDGNQIQR